VNDFLQEVERRVPRAGMTAAALREDFENHLRYTLARDRFSASQRDRYVALSLAVRDRVVDRWMATRAAHRRHNVKRVYYLSLEFLIGRLLGNNVINLQLEGACREAMAALGLDWKSLRDYEVDAGLGNGGLGRLAACFLDSLSTLGYPAIGYGLRYDYGIFQQKIVNGYQVEQPDPWLKLGYPWEIGHPEFAIEVPFEGRVEGAWEEQGAVWEWVDTKKVIGVPYDLPVVGYGGYTVNTLRLWAARAAEEFDLEDFNRGSYLQAVESKVQAEKLTKVLYPNDNTFEGKELRLRQEYFFVSCSIQDLLRRFREAGNPWESLPDKVFIQLNDTHPALAIPELMRLLMDREGFEQEDAWRLTEAVMGYTNHTILPEALERWPVALLERILPRHLQIIYEINDRFLRHATTRLSPDRARLRRMSLIDEDGQRSIRMAHLAIVGSSSVNGVAEIHTRLLKERVLQDFAELWPAKFSNKTNGITPRRWLLKANPLLAGLISEAIGDGWVTDLEQLRRLEPLAEDAGFRERFRAIKQRNKEALATFIANEVGVIVSPDSLFDVQAKRLHEYKRQLLLVLHTILQYNRLMDDPTLDVVPRTVVFSAKAAPGYAMSKLIIKLIHEVAAVVNGDREMRGRLRVVFLPNYQVSLAERIIPAANLSEQISLAGTEASGTGNMKFQLNGALTIGTLDGANVEIREEVGADNIFIFGMTPDEVAERRATYSPWPLFRGDAEIRRAFQMIERDAFSRAEPGIFAPILNALLHWGDQYMLLADLPSYAAAQAEVDRLYRDPHAWDRKAILNVAGAGKFSSDRTIRQYAEEIWHIQPCPVEAEGTSG